MRDDPQDSPVYLSFEDLQVPEGLRRALSDCGLEHPNTVQRRAIRPIAEGRDAVVQARPGSGKTAALLVGALQRIDYGRAACQVLVLTPTRDEARRTHQDARLLGRRLGLRAHVCDNGARDPAEAESLASGPHLVIGTPSRLLGVLQQRQLRLGDVRVCAIDAADVVLGLWDGVLEILMLLPAEVQGCMLSATARAEGLATMFMERPVQIVVGNDELILDSVRQFYVNVSEDHKLEAFWKLCDALTISQTIAVYVSTPRRLDTLVQEVKARGLTVSVVEADGEQSEPTAALQEFHAGPSRVLLSVEPLDHYPDVKYAVVLNYDAPANMEAYLQLVGRRGRSGRTATVITFATYWDELLLQSVRRRYMTPILELPTDATDLL